MEPGGVGVAVGDAGLILLQVDSRAEGGLRVEGKPVAAVVLEPGVHFPGGLGDIEFVDSIVPLSDFAHFFTFMI